MHRIALINMKGGCGKTTIATSLAAYYASIGLKSSLTDYDSQGSSLDWLKHRDIDKPTIYGIDAYNRNKATTLSWQLRPPADTQVSIIDTPAGLNLEVLRKIIEQSDTLLIPVMPSAIDIQAAVRFIEILLIQGKARAKGKNIGIIANRIHSRTLAYQTLKKFIARLDIPLIARFRGVQCYIHAIDKGIGIHESTEKQAFRELYQWDKLIRWLDQCNPHKAHPHPSPSVANKLQGDLERRNDKPLAAHKLTHGQPADKSQAGK